MPGQDGTGPMGNGPRTGRGMGRCRPLTSRKSGQADQTTDRPETEMESMTPEGDEVMFGVGRGGRPYGGGRGRCFGGGGGDGRGHGRRRGQGRGQRQNW